MLCIYKLCIYGAWKRIFLFSEQGFGIMAQETGTHDVLARSVHAFACGLVLRIASVGHLYVVHCPIHAFCSILCGIGGMFLPIGHKGFHSSSAGTYKAEYGT